MAARTAPAKSVAPLILLGAAAVSVALGWNHLPALAGIYLGFIAVAWTEHPTALTGAKDAMGAPTPANPAELRSLRMYRFWADLKWKMVAPSADWLPGRPVLGSFVAAIAAAACAYLLPVTEPTWRWVNAALAFICIVQPSASHHRAFECPGTDISSLKATLADKRSWAAAIAGLAVGLAGSYLFLRWQAKIPALYQWPYRSIIGLSLPWVTAFGGFGIVWHIVGLAHWREVVARNELWEPRFRDLKFNPAPRCVDTATVGAGTVDTFEAPAAQGSTPFLALTPKITPMVPGHRVTLLSVPDENSQGAIPGTRHPRKFQVVAWPTDQDVDITDPLTPADVAALHIRCGLVGYLEPQGYGLPVPLDCDPLHTEDSPRAAWQMHVTWPGGPDLKTVRPFSSGFAGMIGAQVVIDHRGNDGGRIYAGALQDDETLYIQPNTRRAIDNLALEDVWNAAWGQALKQGVNPPMIQHGSTRELALADGSTITRFAFAVLRGLDPMEHSTAGTEAKLMTAYTPTGFLSVCGYTDGVPGRPGERHDQAFVIYHSARKVPATPERLAPAPAASWVLSGLVNTALDAMKLPRPEVVNVRALTKPSARTHLWQIRLRLYGGITFGDIRTRTERLRQALGTTWLAVSEADDGCILYAGSHPDDADLANPRRDTTMLKSLVIEQAWLKTKLSGIDGRLPTLVDFSTMELNQQVEVLEFDLPPGIDIIEVRKILPTLKTNMNCEYVAVVPSTRGAAALTMYRSARDPMPKFAPYDYAVVAASSFVPFATGIDGNPVVYNWKEGPHLLLAGGSGAGKSAALQMLIVGCLYRRARVLIVDPTKGAADFQFLGPWADFIADDLPSSAAVLRGVYAEVRRRVTLNKQHGTSSYRDLPESVRPGHIVIVVDEFTSLMMAEDVPKTPYDDVELEQDRQHLLDLNNSRREIGMLVGRIAREARSAGVTLLLATQALKSDTLQKIPGASDLKDNLARLLLGRTTFGQRSSALRTPEDAPDLGEQVPIGRGIFEPSTSGPVAMQVWYDSTDKLAAALTADVPATKDKFDPTPYLRGAQKDTPAVQEVDLDDIVELADTELVLDLGDLDLDDDGGDPAFDLSALVVGSHTQRDHEPSPGPPEDPAPDRPAADDPFTVPWDVPDSPAEPAPDLDDPFAAPWQPRSGPGAAPQPARAADQAAPVPEATDDPFAPQWGVQRFVDPDDPFA